MQTMGTRRHHNFSCDLMSNMPRTRTARGLTRVVLERAAHGAGQIFSHALCFETLPDA
jgi:hypothetical protein